MSASCSAKSPVSVQSEKSECTECADEREDRRLPFSLPDFNAKADSAERTRDCERRGRRGMVGDVRPEDVDRGMLAVVGADLHSPSPR